MELLLRVNGGDELIAATGRADEAISVDEPQAERELSAVPAAVTVRGALATIASTMIRLEYDSGARIAP
eukprot:SAG11_NODE_3608_length_2343_cov_1.882799_3_plen_69_part_00